MDTEQSSRGDRLKTCKEALRVSVDTHVTGKRCALRISDYFRCVSCVDVMAGSARQPSSITSSRTAAMRGYSGTRKTGRDFANLITTERSSERSVDRFGR